MQDPDLRSDQQNSLADRSKSLARYGLSRIGQNVQLDAVKIRIGQTVNVEIFMAS